MKRGKARIPVEESGGVGEFQYYRSPEYDTFCEIIIIIVVVVIAFLLFDSFSFRAMCLLFSEERRFIERERERKRDGVNNDEEIEAAGVV